MNGTYEIYRDWLVETEARVTGESVLLTAASRQLYRWWRGAAAGGVPLRRSFDVAEHGRLAGGLALVRVLPGGRFENRVVGETILGFSGPDWQRLVLSPDHPQAHVRAMHGYYRRIVETGAPWQCVGRLVRDDASALFYEGIDLPLSLDGRTVSHILGHLSLRR